MNNPLSGSASIKQVKISDDYTMKKMPQIRTSSVNLVQGDCNELLNYVSPNKESLLIPIRPLTASMNSKTRGFAQVNISPFSVCMLERGSSPYFESIVCEQAMLITVTPEWFKRVSQQCLSHEVSFDTPVDVVKQVDIPPLVQSLQRQLVSSDCPTQTYIEMTVRLLFAHVFWQRARVSDSCFEIVDLSADAVHNILVKIDQRMGEQILVKHLAKSMAMSPTRFTRFFKKRVGESPQKYILERRVLRVRELLNEGGLTLADIAFDSGFSSQAHMTTQFVKKFGVPPGEYRRQLDIVHTPITERVMTN